MDSNGDKEDAAQYLEVGDGKEPYGHEGKGHAESYGTYGADEDGFFPLLSGEAVGGHGNNHRIIAAQR